MTFANEDTRPSFASIIEPGAGPPDDPPSASPMRITAHMHSAVVSYGDPMWIDGILAFCAFREWTGNNPGVQLPPISGSWAQDFALPLCTWTAPVPEGGRPHPDALTPDGLLWGWVCSREDADWLHYGSRGLRRMPALDEHKRWGSHASVNVGKGPAKAKNVEIPTRQATRIQWYAFGCVDTVRSWLQEHATHIGKLHNHGCGKVGRWDVEVCDLPDSNVFNPMLGPGIAFRPPRHHVSRRV